MKNSPTSRPAAALSALTPELLQRFDVPGPRYTSYPTADRFTATENASEFMAALEQRMATRADAPLSLYAHIPFCESLCFYCACNKIITRQHGRATEYLRYLEREIALYSEKLGRQQRVTQLHLGGGSPTFLNDDELAALMAVLRQHFALAPAGEFSIEVDPRTVDGERLARIADIGFNRLSFGVQDFDPEVQQAVHRIQPAEQVFDLVATARRLKFQSINVDLIYGLPKQTPVSFRRTIEQVVELRPDRIALYAYAHLPARFKPQRYIDRMAIPSGEQKLDMLSQAIAAFLQHGYVYIGMDHFALPEDELAVARQQGRLHRNFQGYSTQPDCDQVSFGVSAIGHVGATYGQNAKAIDAYYELLDRGEMPIVRGLQLNADDLVRQAVIMSLMCQGRLDYAAIDAAHRIDCKRYFADELKALRTLADDGLVQLTDDGVEVTATGWFFVRAVAMVFDRYLQTNQDRARFSKII